LPVDAETFGPPIDSDAYAVIRIGRDAHDDPTQERGRVEGARRRKDWSTADRLHADLSAQGIGLRDRGQDDPIFWSPTEEGSCSSNIPTGLTDTCSGSSPSSGRLGIPERRLMAAKERFRQKRRWPNSHRRRQEKTMAVKKLSTAKAEAAFKEAVRLVYLVRDDPEAMQFIECHG
jgi:hypothetical protein